MQRAIQDQRLIDTTTEKAESRKHHLQARQGISLLVGLVELASYSNPSKDASGQTCHCCFGHLRGQLIKLKTNSLPCKQE